MVRALIAAFILLLLPVFAQAMLTAGKDGPLEKYIRAQTSKHIDSLYKANLSSKEATGTKTIDLNAWMDSIRGASTPAYPMPSGAFSYPATVNGSKIYQTTASPEQQWDKKKDRAERTIKHWTERQKVRLKRWWNNLWQWLAALAAWHLAIGIFRELKKPSRTSQTSAPSKKMF